MHRLAAITLLFFGLRTADAQLAAVYSPVEQSSVCGMWSSWGPCIWPDGNHTVPYLSQLTPQCKQHWFYTFVRRYEAALNSFYSYMASILTSKKPCGMCSYKQSCGYGGRSKCHLSPFTVRGGRPVMPVFVSERVCSALDLGGDGGEVTQTDACEVDYDKVAENGGVCKLWPAKAVDLSSIEPQFRGQVERMQWYNCKPKTKKIRHRDGTITKSRVCKCCCFPFKPNPKTWKCEHIFGQPMAPGQDLLQEEFNNI